MPSIHLILDWDSTLTTKDTLSVLASIGYEAESSKHLDPKPWSCIVDSYMQDYSNHKKDYLPMSDQRKTIEAESAWLASLADVECRSFMRFKGEKLLVKTSLDEIQSGVTKAIKNDRLVMRPAWDDLLALHNQLEISVEDLSFAILSVNWSTIFIRICLQEAVKRSHSPYRNAVGRTVNTIPIYANEIIQPESDPARSICSSESIHTSAGKVQTLEEIKRESSIVVYIGDSATDFDCLLAADIGICIRDSKDLSNSQAELASIFNRVGVAVKPLWNLTASHSPFSERSKHASSKIWYTSDLKDVVALISQIFEHPER